jgi:CrcB protein
VKILYIVIGGAIGAVLRYGVSSWSAGAHGTGCPFGTMIVNLVGCFLIGLVFGLGESRGINPSFRIFFITGFLGALTTFSSYALETMNSGDMKMAIANITANNIGGLILVKVGLMLARVF